LAVLGIILVAIMLSIPASGMPPHPSLLEKIEKGVIPVPYALEKRAELLAKGVDSPVNPGANGTLHSLAKAAQAQSARNILCIVVEFSDKVHQLSPYYFDTLLFYDRQGTVANYYKEVSYTNLTVVTVDLPSATGWQTAPQTYAYYCNGNNGLGTYPHNSQKLCEDLVDLVDPIVNFANYDNDGDGFVDGLIIVHTGPGAELTGSANDIWSHKWGINPRTKDGKKVSTYTIQPEYWLNPGDMTCGVFAHEMGHAFFDLPDLYDVDYTSNGIGRWSIMAGGSWNGTLGNSPAHYDAWSRIQAGFNVATNVISNINGQSIPNVEGTGTNSIFRLWTNGNIGNEYFLIENRRRTGYDTNLPSEGLLIWHVDEAQATLDNTDNADEWYPGHTSSGHYRLALVQADNLYQLEKKTSNGDGGDPFPGTTNKISFAAASSPSSNDYSGVGTLVGVTNISAAGATMTADLSVSLAAGVDGYGYDSGLPASFDLKQNFPNPFNPQTRISFGLPRQSRVTLTVYNALGEKVDELLRNQTLPAGVHHIDWQPIGSGGSSLPSGIYFYQLTTDDASLSHKMLLLK
jgi:immune inhibitor A